MRKLACCLALALALFAFAGCGKAESSSSTGPSQPAPSTQSATVDIDITEKFYVAYINELYTNTDDYLGKTVRLEGMYTAETFDGITYNYVYRVGPGCCGNDGDMCGFEFVMNGYSPKEGDWVRVTGTLTRVKEGGINFLYLANSKVEVLETRGLENVFE